MSSAIGGGDGTGVGFRETKQEKKSGFGGKSGGEEDEEKEVSLIIHDVMTR